jgi:hypothetical protein
MGTGNHGRFRTVAELAGLSHDAGSAVLDCIQETGEAEGRNDIKLGTYPA